MPANRIKRLPHMYTLPVDGAISLPFRTLR